MNAQYIIALTSRGDGISYITSPRYHTTPQPAKALRFTSEQRAEQFMARWYSHFERDDYDILYMERTLTTP
jgi:hypothetical protein